MTNDLPFGCRACDYYADCVASDEPICGPVIEDEDCGTDELTRAIEEQQREAVEKTSGLS